MIMNPSPHPPPPPPLNVLNYRLSFHLSNSSPLTPLSLHLSGTCLQVTCLRTTCATLHCQERLSTQKTSHHERSCCRVTTRSLQEELHSCQCNCNLLHCAIRVNGVCVSVCKSSDCLVSTSKPYSFTVSRYWVCHIIVFL